MLSKLTCPVCNKQNETLHMLNSGHVICSLCLCYKMTGETPKHIKENKKIKVAGEAMFKKDLNVNFDKYLELSSLEKWYSIRCITKIDTIKNIIQYETCHSRIRRNTAIIRLRKLTK